MTANLRDALATGEADTPAGVDVAAVRRRAGRIRRRRTGLVAAAVAALVAVPLALALVPEVARPTATQPRPGGACPDRYPVGTPNSGPGLDAALVPGTPAAATVCSFQADGRLASAVRLTGDEARSTVARLEARPIHRGPFGGPCPASGSRLPLLLSVLGSGRAITLRFGCETVDNGYLARTVDPDLVGTLTDRTARAVACPAAAPMPDEPAGPTLRRADPLLPVDTQRLVLCAYSGGRPIGSATAESADAAAVTDRIEAAPATDPDISCRRGVIPPRVLVLLAVAPDGVWRATSDLSTCGVIRAGQRAVIDDALVRDLYERATR